MVVGHEMQCRIGEDEVHLLYWMPGFDILLDELGDGDSSARDSKHIVGQIKADDRRARKGRGQQFRAVARTTAKVEDAAGVERRNLRDKITRCPRALALEFHIEGGIPIGHGSPGGSNRRNCSMERRCSLALNRLRMRPLW